MWVNIISIIYGPAPCLTPLTLKLIMTIGMHTKHPSVGILSPFQLIGQHLHRTTGHTGHALNLEHAHRTTYNQ